MGLGLSPSPPATLARAVAVGGLEALQAVALQPVLLAANVDPVGQPVPHSDRDVGLASTCQLATLRHLVSEAGGALAVRSASQVRVLLQALGLEERFIKHTLDHIAPCGNATFR